MPALGLRFPRVGDHWHPQGYGPSGADAALGRRCACGRSAGLSRGAGRQTVPGCVCSGFELPKGRKPCCCFSGSLSAQGRSTRLGSLRWPVVAGGADMEPHSSGAGKRETVAARGSPLPWGACGPLHCVSWMQRPTPLTLLLGAPGGCALPPGRPRNSRDLPHPAWQCPGPRGLRAPG